MIAFRRLTIASVTAALLTAAGPAMAGQDLTIELQNNLKASQPLYPRLTLRATDSLCWYTNDFDDGPSAPAGGGYATFNSEVKNTFFSFCNPTWNPMKDAFARWMQFRIMSQAEPGAEWKPVTWGKSSTFILTYFKLVMDVRGYHFQVAGPGNEVMDTPSGPACVSFDPFGMGFNYSGLYRMTVSPAASGSCGATAMKGSKMPTRKVRVQIDRTKPVVLGQIVPGAKSRWQASACTSKHYTATGLRTEDGPGQSRWQVIDVRGTAVGKDRCVLTLTDRQGQQLMSQRVEVIVR